jgi:hypothetical protein
MQNNFAMVKKKLHEAGQNTNKLREKRKDKKSKPIMLCRHQCNPLDNFHSC